MKRLFSCVALPLLLAACQSKAPLNYYTLTSPTGETQTTTPAPFRFALQSVGVPPQVDQPQLVIRQGEKVTLLENERWISPLADELRSALSDDLSGRLGTLDMADAPRGEGAPIVRIKVDVRRFDSVPGQFVQLDGLWTLRLAEAGGERVLTCGSRVREPAGDDYAAVVAAHRRAIARLAADVEPVARRFVATPGTDCVVR